MKNKKFRIRERKFEGIAEQLAKEIYKQQNFWKK